MEATVTSLLAMLDEPPVAGTNVIRWGSPVPAFGDASQSRVATLGLNPSNREFVDSTGRELNGTSRRFHTLQSLGIDRWAEAKRRHVDLIVDSCRAYFERNPYDTWFKQLDHIISGTSASYYDGESRACHLDLIPFATACKWTMLTNAERNVLLEASAEAFGTMLQESAIETLVLNGRSVVEHFEGMTGVELERRPMPSWALRRGRTGMVHGFSYRGHIHRVGGIDMGRRILILGFNHNIQSSFGVTNKVRSAIRRWVAEQVMGAAA